MFEPKKLTNKEALDLFNAMKLIQISEKDRKTEDGREVIEVIALPPKTAHKVSRQLRKLEGFVDDYKDTLKRIQNEAKEIAKESKDSDEEKSFAEVFNQLIKAHDEQVETFDVIEKPLKYSDDQSKSDFGKVALKSQVLSIAPEGIIDWVE